jgi:hypothetical protein
MGSRRFWAVAAVIWAPFGLITGFQVWISMITHGHSMPRLVGYYVLVWEAGFKDRDAVNKDPDLAKLRNDPRVKELIVAAR